MKRQIFYDDENTPDLDTAASLWFEDLLARNRSPRTVRNARYTIKQFQRVCGEKPIGCYSPQDVRRFILEEKERGLSPYSLESKYATLRGMFAWFEDEGLIDANPFAAVKRPYCPPKPGRILEPEQVDAILDRLHTRRNDWIQERMHAFILTLLDTGMRLSEALSMRVRDGRSDAFIICGKGNRYRTAFLTHETRKRIAIYLRLCPYRLDDEDALWIAEGGTPWQVESAKTAIRNLSLRVGIRFSAHDLRRSCATWLLRNRVDIERIRLLLGHSNLQTTQRYLALVEQDLKETHDRFSPVRQLASRRRR